MSIKLETLCSFGIFFCINISTYLLILSSNVNFYSNFSVFFHISYVFFSCSSYYLLIVVHRNPGVIEYNNNNIELAFSVNTETDNISHSSENAKINNTSEVGIPPNSCEKCHIKNLPLRAHHCSRCDKCIRTYDHHCSLIGGCIGENNAFIFWVFLSFQSIAICHSLYGLLATEFLLYDQQLLNGQVILYVYFVMIAVIGIYIFYSFIFHTYLIYKQDKL